MAALSTKLDRLLSKIPKGSLATVGGVLGGAPGAMAGKGLSKITGYGDYVVSNNTLMGNTVVGEMADQVPIFRNQGADTRVKHCEFVMNLTVPSSGAGYNVTRLPLDPINATTFPWLSSVAKKYQRYKVKGMVIGYRSTSTDYNNSGVVAVVVNYDPSEQTYVSMEGLLNSKFAVSTKPSNSMLAPVECDPGRSPMDGYYIKHVTSTDVTDATLRQTQMGTINIATQGLTLPAGSTIGQVYVSYDIELMYPYMTSIDKPCPPPVVSGVLGAANYSSQEGLDVLARDRGFGNFVGYGDLTDPNRQIALKLSGSPTASSPLGGGDGWLGLVLPTGTYRIHVADNNWKANFGTESLSGGSQTSPTPGSSVSVINSGITAFGMGGSTMVGEVVAVRQGEEEDRTYFPAQARARTLNGALTFVSTSIFIEHLGGS